MARYTVAALALVLTCGGLVLGLRWRSQPELRMTARAGESEATGEPLVAPAPPATARTTRTVATRTAVPSAARSGTAGAPATPDVRSAAALMLSAVPTPVVDPPDERSLFTRLEQLGVSDPQESLRLVALAESRYRNSPEAPKLGWYKAKALVEQKRFAEAQQEARELVRRYPQSTWAREVERHLLVYPLGQPSREQMQAEMQRRR